MPVDSIASVKIYPDEFDSTVVFVVTKNKSQ